MKKLLLIIAIVFIVGIGFHIHRRKAATFFYVNNEIRIKTEWKFNEERYEILEMGTFRIEKGNLFIYTEEVFGPGSYVHKLRILGLPVKYRNVDYIHNYCYGFPGIPGVEWFKGWPDKGKQRFGEALAIIELYKKHPQ